MDVKNFLKDSKNKEEYSSSCEKVIVPYHFDYYDDDNIKYFDQRKHKKNDQITIVKSAIRIEIEGKQIALDPRLDSVAAEIEKSKYILGLEDDWDDFGAIVPSKDIYNRAVWLLINYATFILEQHKIAIKAPEINPGKNGSIDLEWRNNFELLINISNTTHFHASYYGETKDQGSNAIEGFLKAPDVNEDLAYWMRKLA